MWWEHPVVLGVGGAAAVLVGITTIWGKGIVPAYRGVVRFFKALRKFADSIDILFDIAKEFKPNGGHSLHDRITRIENRQEAMGAEVADIARKVDTIITEEIPIITALAEHVTDLADPRSPSR